MEKWGANGEIERQSEIENQLPATQEENKNDSRAGFLEIEENGGDQNQNQTQQETNDENLRNVESGGDEITTIEELEGLVGDECMELREEQGQMENKNEEEEKQVLTALALFEAIIVGQCQLKWKKIKMRINLPKLPH